MGNQGTEQTYKDMCRWKPLSKSNLKVSFRREKKRKKKTVHCVRGEYANFMEFIIYKVHILVRLEVEALWACFCIEQCVFKFNLRFIGL